MTDEHSAPTETSVFLQRYTADDIEKAIEHAMRKHDVEAVANLIKLLAMKDAERAESVRRIILAGLEIAKQRG